MTSSTVFEPPCFADIESAARRIEGKAVRTPLLESPLLNERIGGRLLIKAEPLQRTGSFKFRGAYNRISRLNAEEIKRGVVAFSSGNHAQGIAAAAHAVGAPATIVMPSDAPAIKRDNTRAWGAEIMQYDRYKQDRDIVARDLANKLGAILVPPFDHPLIIAGQGTIGLEIVEQAKDMDASLDALLSPCGGGGLISGCALALEERSPGTEIFSVEPVGFDDTARSLATGTRQESIADAHSFCDALLTNTPGVLTFSINQRLLAGGLVVSDDEVAQAMAIAMIYLKLVCEPGGATALAAVLSGKYDCRGKTVVVIVSGGNVDAAMYAEILKNAQP